jgi:hypothetical protein
MQYQIPTPPWPLRTAAWLQRFYMLFSVLRNLRTTPTVASSEDELRSELSMPYVLSLSRLFAPKQRVQHNLIRGRAFHLLVCSDQDEGECAICMERKADVALSCSHAFCNACISAWKQRSQTCPMCRAAAGAHEDDWVLVPTGKTKHELAEFLGEYLNRVCNS